MKLFLNRLMLLKIHLLTFLVKTSYFFYFFLNLSINHRTENFVPDIDPIWDEPESEEGRLLYSESGAIRCGTLNKLVIQLTHSKSTLLIFFITSNELTLNHEHPLRRFWNRVYEIFHYNLPVLHYSRVTS